MVVDEHQVDVARIVQLVAAELAERQGREPGRLAVRAGRGAEPIRDGLEGVLQGDVEGRVGEPGQLAGDLFERAVAEDVVDADAQRVAVAEPAERPERGRVVRGGVHLGGQLGGQLGGGRVAVRRVADTAEQLGVGGEGVGEELGGGEQLEGGVEAAAAGLGQLRQLVAGGRLGEEAFEVVQRHVRVGRPGQEPAECGGEVVERVGADVRPQRGEVPPAAVRVAEGLQDGVVGAGHAVMIEVGRRAHASGSENRPSGRAGPVTTRVPPGDPPVDTGGSPGFTPITSSVSTRP